MPPQITSNYHTELVNTALAAGIYTLHSHTVSPSMTARLSGAPQPSAIGTRVKRRPVLAHVA